MRRYKIALFCSVAFSATTLASLPSPALANISTSGDAGYNSNSIWAGNNAGSTGSISVSDGSSINTLGSGAIGTPSGNGTLNINSGGSVTINDPNGNGGGLQVGGQPNGTGTIIVDGKGSILNAKGNAKSGYGTSIGYAGNGSLTIQNGGAGNFQNGLTIGGNAKGGDTNATDSSKGTVTVDGNGSTLNASAGGGFGNIIGDNTHGSGTLNVQNGGQANYSGTVDVGVNSGSTGSINVSGAGSTLKINGDGDFGGGGNKGHGILNVKDGANATISDDVYLGHNTQDKGGLTGYGTADISGSGSSLDVGGDLMMAGQITGTNDQISTLTVENNAKTHVGGDLVVGYSGSGEVDIKNGGNLTSNALTLGGGWYGSNNTVNVDGKNSILSTKNTQIGAISPDGSQSSLGTMNVTNSAHADLGNTRIDKGILKITGATGDANSLVIGNRGGSDGTVTVDGGSTLKVGDPSKPPSFAGDGSGNGEVAVGFNGKGALNVDGNGSTVDANWMFIGNNAGSNGTVNVKNNGTLNVSNGQLIAGYNSGSNGTLNISDGGSLNLSNGQLVAGYVAGSTGTINVNNGHLNANNDYGIIGLNGKGTFNLSNNGTANFNELKIGENGTATISSGGNLIVDKKQGNGESPVLYVDNDGNNAGKLTIDGGTVTATNEKSAVPAFAVGTGDGQTFKDGGAVAEATIKNGGKLTVNGSTQIGAETSGTLNIDGKGSTFQSWGNAGVWGGKNNYGTLNITNGGLWDQKSHGSGSLVVNGAINVDGQGSLANLNFLDLGNGDNGAIANVTNSGKINTDGVNVGDTVKATMNLSDNAVVNILSGDSIVGNKANGTLNVDKNSHFGNNSGDKTGNLIVANSKGTTGTVNVTNGSNLSLNQGNLTVGEAGTGLVNVSDSIMNIASGNLTVGDQAGSSGKVSLDKSSSTLTFGSAILGNKAGSTGEMDLKNGSTLQYAGSAAASNQLTIGSDGSGKLTLDNSNLKGGIYNNGNLSIAGGNIAVGFHNGSSGELDLHNNSKMDWNQGTLTLGDSGKGTMIVDSGSQVHLQNTGLMIGNQGNSDGTLNIDGKGSVVSMENQGVTLGQNAEQNSGVGKAASGTINVTNGGGFYMDADGNSSDSSDTLTVGNLGNGTVNVNGAGSQVNLNNGNLTVGNNKIPSFGTGTSYVNISNGGVLDANSAIVAAGGDADLTVNNGTANFKNGLTIGQNSGSNGLVTISNGSILNAANGLTIGDSGSGTLTIDGKNTVNSTNNDFKIANQTGSSGTFTLQNAASWTANDIAAGAGTSQINVGQAKDTTNSTLNVGGNVTMAKGGSGTIALDHGTLNFTGKGDQSEEMGVSLQDTNSSISVAEKSGKTTISGIVSGVKGLLRKTGLGELILGNDNSYGGGTEIDAGTLTGHVNQDGSGSFGSGAISDKATLQIAQNKDGDFKNALSGTGDLLINAKGGTIALSGDESRHTGKTTINQGGATLSSATNYGGGFDIAAGGKLSGLGTNGTATIKGNLNNNGQLVVGSGDGKQTGTLNVDGNLFLAGGSNTTFAESSTTDLSKVGLSNAVAGNDLINVAGNLTLGDATGAGIINVNSALENNASLGDGAYRLVNYGGSLTDTASKLGSVAVDPYHTAVLETGVDKEVNLLITDKTVLGTGTIWNGGNVTDAAKNQVGDKVVGGDGTWSNANTYNIPNSPSSISWSQPDDKGNMTYGNSWADGKTAIFQGTGGTVTISDQVDGKNSQVKAAGLSFNADGYTLKGDTLSDDGNGMLISVGDGKSDGAKYTANIDNQLSTAAIVKQDLGTLNLNSDGNIANSGVDVRGGTMNLNGNNNQFGGTSVVEAGSMLNANGKASLGSSLLRINQGGQADIALQSIADTATITDNGRLDIGGSQNNAKAVQNESGTLGNTLSGAGILNKFGTGNVSITGNNSAFLGQTQVNNGTLDLNGGNMSNSAVLVDAGGVADGDIVQKNATLTAENGASAKSLTLADATSLKDGSQTSNNLVAAGLKVTDGVTVGSGDNVTLNKAENAPSLNVYNDFNKTQNGSSLDVGGDLNVAVNGGNNSNVTLNDGSSLKTGGNIALGNAALNAADASILTAKNLVMGGDLTGNGQNTKTTANLSNTSLSVGGSMAVNNGDLTADRASVIKIGGSAVVGSGKNSDATLNVQGGSSLSASSLVLGTNGGNGTLNLSDSGSALNVSKQAVIGQDGKGTLNISGKGNSFTSNNISLGVDKGSSGAINLADGTSLNTQGTLVHGAGTGTMSLTNASLNATGDLRDNLDTSFSGQNAINTNNNFVNLDGRLSGNGGFDKTGSGILQINNKGNDYHGATNINQGILQGVGTIGGDLNMSNGTTLRAGISSDPSVQYGKMQVNGNTVMQTGSTMEANLGLYPQASGLNDSGSFTIQDGATLKTSVAEGAQLKMNQAYDVVHADGGVQGKFTNYQQDGKIGSDAADGYSVLKGDFGHPAYGKDDVSITLSFDRNKDLGWDGDRNQHNTGGALTPSVYNPTALSPVADALAGNTNEQRLHNLTQMDGEIASDMRTGNINSNFWIRDSVNNRLDCLEDTFRQIGNGRTTSSNVCGVTGKKVNVWGNMYGSVGGQSGHSGWNYANKVKNNNAGFIWGVDGEIGSDGYAEDRWHIGMMMGYGSVMESARGVSSSGESNNANIGMYFGKQVRFDNQNFFTFHGQFGYTWNIMSWHRSLDLQGATSAYNQSLHANELGGTAHINAEIGYKHVFNLWGTPLEVAPTGSITYLNYEQGSYHEHGGNLALHGAATNTNLGYGFMGAKLATNFNVGNWVVSPHGKFGYRRSFGANQSYTNAGFSALGSGTDMSIVGVPVVQDQALTELGFDVHPTEFFSFGANYVGLYGGHGSTMSGGQLSAKFAF